MGLETKKWRHNERREEEKEKEEKRDYGNERENKGEELEERKIEGKLFFFFLSKISFDLFKNGLKLVYSLC